MDPLFTVWLLGEPAKLKSDPVPVSCIVWGLPASSSLIIKVPKRVPEAVGEKVTLIVQAAPVARVVAQLSVCE